MISLYTYRLPFKTPLTSGTRTYLDREGVLVHFKNKNFDCVGEAAPLPGLSEETLTETVQVLHTNLKTIHNLLVESTDRTGFSSGLDSIGLPPSAAFAISAIGLQRLSARTGKQLSELMGCPFRDTIDINSMVGIEEPEILEREISNRYSAGFRTVKVKCGTLPGDLPRTLREVFLRHPDIRFRIDANRSWPVDRVSEYLGMFTGLPIEYCEEPSRFENFSDLHRVSSTSQIPIALDETIDSLSMLNKLISEKHSEVMIIKPPLFGNIDHLIGTIQNKRTSSKNIVFTSMMESGIGRKVTGFLASISGSSVRAHGLDTGRFFKKDIVSLPFKNGTFQLNPDQGWGVTFEHCNKESLTLLTSYDA